jgi:TonB family protein
MTTCARSLALALLALGVSAAAHAAELVVAWGPHAAPVEGYQVERRIGGPVGEFKPIARVAASATRFVDRSVSAGVRYCYRLRGVRGERLSSPSAPLCNVAREAPPAAAAPAAAPVPTAQPPSVSAAPPRRESRAARPLFRPPPAYPHAAQIEGISGWVKLSFTVKPDGTTQEVRVVAAEPPGVFDASALSAARNFVYAPRHENGVAVEQPDVTTEINFTWIDRGGNLVTDRRPAPR